jgi:N-acetylglucosaminyldiphosphoundecaprenol N-acetyl-beta-D-mannosaminyltransferase
MRTFVNSLVVHHAGTIQRALLWMQHAGLEWLHRLASESRRLWKLCLVMNTFFVPGAARQLVADHVGH